MASRWEVGLFEDSTDEAEVKNPDKGKGKTKGKGKSKGKQEVDDAPRVKGTAGKGGKQGRGLPSQVFGIASSDDEP
jgi:hypothetical protein